MKEAAAKAVVVVVTLAAVVRVATAHPPPTGKTLTEVGAHDAYRDVTSRERQMRRDAAVKFPGDLWSQDDDFHQREADEMRSFSSGREVRLSDVLRAVDDGMHERWLSPVTPIATVPPCRPRLSY